MRDGDAFVATILTQGGWDPRHANGGTVLALLGHCLDDVPTLTPMSVSRLTADLVRPVPMGERLEVSGVVLREGKKIQLVELVARIGDVEHVRMTALRLRDADLSGGPVPASTTDGRPADALQAPEEALRLRDAATHQPGFFRAVDMRRAQVADGGAPGCWVRLDVPIVAEEPVSATGRLAFAIDYANLIGLETNQLPITMINPDVSAHVLRPPVGDWIGLTGDTRFNPGLGRGMSTALLSDEAGVFATSSICQLLQER